MHYEDYEKHKKMLTVKILRKPNSMAEVSSFLWKRISLEKYSFDDGKLEIDSLKAITKEKIFQFCEVKF